ncbi:MAG: TraR/DksA C4-type zinc finger protein [Anaerolineae bacterium]|nr:TraR/DksA C4-type zinc finger protein [Anaerolineae bacterium]
MTNEMTAESRETIIRQRLQDSLRAAQEELSQIQQRLQDKGDYGPGTGDPLVVRWELNLARRDRVESRIEDLEHALERLEEGTYGVCESCGKPIDLGRLEALPQTELCIECARNAGEGMAA